MRAEGWGQGVYGGEIFTLDLACALASASALSVTARLAASPLPSAGNGGVEGFEASGAAGEADDLAAAADAGGFAAASAGLSVGLPAGLAGKLPSSGGFTIWMAADGRGGGRGTTWGTAGPPFTPAPPPQQRRTSALTPVAHCRSLLRFP